MGNVEDPDEAANLVWGQVASDACFRVVAPTSTPTCPTTRERTGHWEKLAAGATVAAPLAPSPWAPLYGMFTDRCGITWVIDVQAPWS